MPYAALLPVLVAVAICLVPVWLLRQTTFRGAHDDLVAVASTRFAIVRNASIAYALRTSILGSLIAWGAGGDLWPVIAGSVFLGCGILLIYAVRQPVVSFLDDALASGRSITVHAFVARRHGDDPRVRLLAASLTVLSLGGLIVGEALALATFVKPVFQERTMLAGLIVSGAVILAAVPAIAAGSSGALHFAQLLLGMLYLALFGSLALLVYQEVSALAPLQPHGILAVVVIVASSAAMLYYRRSRYVDTTPIGGARWLARVGKLLNICVSVALALLLALGVMALFAAEALPRTLAALWNGTRLPGTALIALCLVPLVYPLVDVANWQRIAALRKDAPADPERQSFALRGILRIVGFESALMWLVVGAFGAVTLAALEIPGGADVVQASMVKLAAGQGDVAGLVFPLLLILIFAAALSTMSAQFSACLGTIRHDLMSDSGPAVAGRRRVVLGAALAVASAIAFILLDAFVTIRFADGTFLASLFAIGCAQLAMTPLVLGPIVWPRRGAVRPEWALAILWTAAASAVAVAAVYLVSGVQAWLWAAVPASLGSGFALFAIARAR